MDKETIRSAWEECELEELEQVNGTLIDPAVFEPEMDDEFKFEDRPYGELWDAIKSMEEVSFMTEPLDGFLRCSAYVWLDDNPGQISFKSYTTRVKISPADEDCSYEAFEHFIQQFEEHVCDLTFLGGLDEMDMDE